MNWGFIGFGRIARKFLESLESVEGEVPFAFASKSNAAALAKEFPKVRIYESYEDLVQDPLVEIVYISTTHNFHCENTLLALRHGKHVVCEKPMGVKAAEVARMAGLAREKRLFLMEALWMRFLPAYREAIARAKSGELGAIRCINAGFGFRSVDKLAPEGRLLNPDLAGGALYDVGVYPLTLVADLFGWEPVDFKVHAIQSATGVDETIQVQLDFGNDRLAQVAASFALHTDKQACIYGEKGYIRLERFWQPQGYEIYKDDEVEAVSKPFQSTGYAHEIMEAVRCIREGKTESNLFTIKDSLMSAKLVESILNTITKT